MYGKPSGHPQDIMKQLGITYAEATPQSMLECWWFWNCENVPANLPKYITELKLKPAGAVGHGLSKERAKQLSDPA
jgi:hypothetical protein